MNYLLVSSHVINLFAASRVTHYNITTVAVTFTSGPYLEYYSNQASCWHNPWTNRRSLRMVRTDKPMPACLSACASHDWFVYPGPQTGDPSSRHSTNPTIIVSIFDHQLANPVKECTAASYVTGLHSFLAYVIKNSLCLYLEKNF